jgi:hypothetical protein
MIWDNKFVSIQPIPVTTSTAASTAPAEAPPGVQPSGAVDLEALAILSPARIGRPRRAVRLRGRRAGWSS